MLLETLQRLFTERRQRFAFPLGAASWLAWFVIIATGSGVVDAVGRPIGTDFVQFYAAGYALRNGLSADLYNFTSQWELERAIVGPQHTALYAFITPPHLAWLYAPLSLLPYGVSFALWSLSGFVFLWVAFRLLGATDWRPFAWSLTWNVVFASISYGQNSLLSLCLLSGAYLCWKLGRPYAAGIGLSLVMYKPQLALGVAVIWLLEREWRGLLALMGGTAITVALSFYLLPESSAAYLVFARTVLPSLPQWLDFPLWNLHTLRGFWQLLLPGVLPLADGLTILSALIGFAGTAILWRRHRGRKPILYAAAICLSWWLTPHAMVYDLAILLIPAYLLWRELSYLRAAWRPIFAVVWLITIFGPALSYLQHLALPIVVQVSVPILCGCLYLSWRLLLTIEDIAGPPTVATSNS